MVGTAIAIERFPKTLNRHSRKTKKGELEEILTKIYVVRTANPTVYDNKSIHKYLKDRAKVIEGLVEDYFTAATAQEFPLLSDELFQLKRHITVEKGEKGYAVVRDNTEPDRRKRARGEARKLEIPLFAYTELLRGDHKVELGKFSKRETRDYHTKTTTVKIGAELPGVIGPNLRDAYRGALSHYFGIMSNVFAEPTIGELMLQDQLQAPEIGAIWIPTLESLQLKVSEKIKIEEPKVLDPAMIMRVRGQSYLVDTWDVDNEEPYKKHILEFATGNVNGKLGNVYSIGGK